MLTADNLNLESPLELNQSPPPCRGKARIGAGAWKTLISTPSLTLPLAEGGAVVAPNGLSGLNVGRTSVRRVELKSDLRASRGFTLVEMIIVMVITGIIGGMVAMFIKAPIQGYVDSARRAELTDIADTALRRISRDVRTSVPNSLRIANCGGVPCVEFLPTKDGGRYRALQDCTAVCTGNTLTFGVVNGIFDVIGPPPALAAGDYIVVGSTQSDGSLPYDQTGTGVLRAYTSLAGQKITMNSVALPLSSELPSQRFDVVDGAQQAVTYACVGGGVDASGTGIGQLIRYSAYGFQSTQQTPVAIAANTAPVTTHSQAILADKVDCTKSFIDYNIPNQRFGLLDVRLTLTSNNESVSLYNEIHVNNLP